MWVLEGGRQRGWEGREKDGIYRCWIWMKNVFWFDPLDAHLLEAIPRNLIRSMMCDSHHIYSLHLERDLNISGLSLKKENSFSCSLSPPNTCIMHSSFQNDFIYIILFGSQCGVAERKLDVSRGPWIVVWALFLNAGDLGEVLHLSGQQRPHM